MEGSLGRNSQPAKSKDALAHFNTGSESRDLLRWGQQTAIDTATPWLMYYVRKQGHQLRFAQSLPQVKRLTNKFRLENETINILKYHLKMKKQETRAYSESRETKASPQTRAPWEEGLSLKCGHNQPYKCSIRKL